MVPTLVVRLSTRRGPEDMQEAVKRVMEAYGLMVVLSPSDEAEARGRLLEHLRGHARW
jgi:hypothetical protein